MLSSIPLYVTTPVTTVDGLHKKSGQITGQGELIKYTLCRTLKKYSEQDMGWLLDRGTIRNPITFGDL